MLLFCFFKSVVCPCCCSSLRILVLYVFFLFFLKKTPSIGDKKSRLVHEAHHFMNVVLCEEIQLLPQVQFTKAHCSSYDCAFADFYSPIIVKMDPFTIFGSLFY